MTDYVQKSVETSHEGKVTILWNQQVRTGRNIPDNKSDNILRDNVEGSCMLIDIAIPGHRNVFKKEDEKFLKYKHIRTDIQLMWNVKAKVIPIIIWTTGTISMSLRQYLSNIPRKHEIKELQKNQQYCALHTNCGKC